MDFIYELYQNDNFVIYLTIALVILIILFVVVLFLGKRDKKLEETRKLQKIEQYLRRVAQKTRSVGDYADTALRNIHLPFILTLNYF